jgi:hypothetical protein
MEFKLKKALYYTSLDLRKDQETIMVSRNRPFFIRGGSLPKVGK